MTIRVLVFAAWLPCVGLAAGCTAGHDSVVGDIAATVHDLRMRSGRAADVADYDVDTYGHIEVGALQRSWDLPLEPRRATPYQEFRVFMSGRERWGFYGLHWDQAPTGEGDPDPLLDRRERYLRAHGTRIKWQLRYDGLKAGLDQTEAEELVTKTLGTEPTWRDSSDDDMPGLTTTGEVDYSHDVIERVAFKVFNGTGMTHVWLHFRNGALERWEVHAETN